MVSQVLWARLWTRTCCPQYLNISGMNGSASSAPVSSSVARISRSLRTSTISPARRLRAYSRDASPGMPRPLNVDLAILKGGRQFPTVERFRIIVGRVALHTPHAHERAKQIFREPSLLPLAREAGEDGLDLTPAQPLVERDEEVRNTEIAVVLGYLVLQNEVISERVPGQLRDQAVVLVEIVAMVSQDQ